MSNYEVNSKANNANGAGEDGPMDLLIKQMAASHQPQLPSAGLIWWRAQVLKKLETKERIERPMVIMRMLVAILGAMLVVGMAVANWRELHTMQQSSFALLVSMVVIAFVAIVMTSLRAFRA
jgi:hypothetical protein